MSAAGGRPTTRSLVGYESWLERDWLMLLDFDPDVVGIAAQPFWLLWTRRRANDAHTHRTISPARPAAPRW